jgi:hypothetical protein
VGGLFALSLAAAGLVAAYGTGTRILGQADFPFARFAPGQGGQGPQLRVIRSQEELLQASGLPGDGKSRVQLENFLTRAFQLKAVNFHRRTLVVVSGGVQPTDGYRVEVTKIDLDQGTMRVHWKLHCPGPGQPVAPRATHPAAVVLLKRFDGDVKLEPEETDAVTVSREGK